MLDLGFRVWSFGFRVPSLGFGISGFGFRVRGFGSQDDQLGRGADPRLPEERQQVVFACGQSLGRES